MTLTPWTHENAFLPGTIVRADAMNLKLDGIAQAIQAICNQINQKIPNLPATFTGETQIPEKTLPNTLLLINSAGAMDLYPKAQFDADVANAASAALQAATSATNAQNSANQAQVHKQNAEEHAEAAFNSASAAATFAESAKQAKDDTMSALNTRLGTTGNLGNAAQRNVMTSLTDTATPDALMPRGAFGLGQSATRRTPQLDDEFFNSFSATSATWNSSPYPGTDGNNQGGAITLKHEDPTYWWNLWFGLGRDELRFRRIAAGIAGSWRTLFHNANIVGPVAQSGGLPTAAIIESGSNANGSYVRYANGTQICKTVERLTGNRNIADGNIFKSALLGPFSWPANFQDRPTCFANTPDSETGWFGLLGTQSTIYATAYHPTSTTIDRLFSITAIGRWY